MKKCEQLEYQLELTRCNEQRFINNTNYIIFLMFLYIHIYKIIFFCHS